ncbi:MAG: restriction endonuclease subunit S [Hominilimicola sp.]|jgi:hypothetical protein|uniref:restriction endonuclease subunit S n=3 Tax=Eubacteriales TaxID=186802 RepID=UPI00399354A7
MAKYRFGDICKVLNGRAYKQNELLASGKYPILRVGNFFSSDRWYYSDMELPEDKYCDYEDLLFAWSASFGPKIWDGEKVIYHYHIWKLIPNDDIADKWYLYYWLRHSVNRLTAGTHGSVMAHMTKGDMENQSIELPSLQTQRKISSILRTIDEKIHNNVAINNNLLEQIKTICTAWLSEYKPFDGVMPSDWVETPLSDIAEFISGYSYKGTELTDSTIAMATIKNFDRKGGFKLDGYKEIIPSSKLKESQHAELFDTLVAHTDLTQNAEVIGNAELVMSKSGYDDIVFSMDLVKVLPKKDGVSKFLIAAILQDKKFKAHCLGYVNGTTVLHLSKKALPEYKLLLPSDFSTLKPLDEVVTALYKQVSSNISENTYLEELRESLLPKLMSGELDVSNIEL